MLSIAGLSFGRTGSQARGAAFGHGRWHLWFGQTYEGNMSLSIPRNMRMTTQGMLRLNSNPGMEPKRYLLQRTTKYLSVISHEVSMLLTVFQYTRRAISLLYVKQLTVLTFNRTFSLVDKLKLCLFFCCCFEVKQFSSWRKSQECAHRQQHPHFPGKATTTTTATAD